MDKLHLNLSRVLIVSVTLFWSLALMAQQTTVYSEAQTGSQGLYDQIATGSQVEEKIEPTEKDKMKVTNQSPLGNCKGTKSKAVHECKKPSGNGFQAATAVVSGLGSTIMGMKAQDAGAAGDSAALQSTQQMCVGLQMIAQLVGSLNGAQGETCGFAEQACSEQCTDSIDKLNAEIKALSDSLAGQTNPGTIASIQQSIKVLQEQQEQIEKTLNSCVDEVRQHQAQAMAAKQGSQNTGQGAQGCEAALAAGDDPFADDDQAVDCSLPEYQYSQECLGVGSKTNPDGVDGLLGSSDVDLAGLKDDSDPDLPLAEEQTDYSKYKKTGDDSSGGGSGGGLGFAGSSGSGNNAAGKTGSGYAPRGSGSGSLYGGRSAEGGGGSWGAYGSNGKGKGGLSKYRGKKDKLKIPKKRKLAGYKLGQGSEFSLSSGDIWTRVYLKSNTNCVSKLVKCSANRSKSPYGDKKGK